MSEIILNAQRDEIFKKHFLEPVKKLQELGKLNDPEENSKTYREIWLQQGIQDFDNPNSDCKLTSYELVELYCYYYLQMHYSSSKLVFDNGTETLKKLCNANNPIHFIDYGCGPMTSGIAFNHWMQENDIEGIARYYGIDTSLAMRSKAEKLLNEPSFVSHYKVFKVTDHFSVVDKIDGHNNILVINCCYLFASDSLVVDDFVDDINRILELATTHNPKEVPQVIIIYQNPHLFDHEKWREFKSKMDNFKSIGDYPQMLAFSYNSATQSTCTFSFKVDVDVIKNF